MTITGVSTSSGCAGVGRPLRQRMTLPAETCPLPSMVAGEADRLIGTTGSTRRPEGVAPVPDTEILPRTRWRRPSTDASRAAAWTSIRSMTGPMRAAGSRSRECGTTTTGSATPSATIRSWPTRRRRRDTGSLWLVGSTAGEGSRMATNRMSRCVLEGRGQSRDSRTLGGDVRL